jgi:hypothetical protein
MRKKEKKRKKERKKAMASWKGRKKNINPALLLVRQPSSYIGFRRLPTC